MSTCHCWKDHSCLGWRAGQACPVRHTSRIAMRDERKDHRTILPASAVSPNTGGRPPPLMYLATDAFWLIAAYCMFCCGVIWVNVYDVWNLQPFAARKL